LIFICLHAFIYRVLGTFQRVALQNKNSGLSSNLNDDRASLSLCELKEKHGSISPPA